MRGFTHRCSRRRGLGTGVLAALTVVLGGMAVPAAGAAAAGVAAHAVASPAATSGSVMAGVSCLPSRWCMAVGKSGKSTAAAWLWRHGAWHRLADPPGGALTGVSCPARTFCMATGLRGLSAAVVWNGTSWRVMAPAPQHVITAPSCPARNMCAVINGTGLHGSGAIAETWNGQVWKSWKDTSFCGNQPSACGALDVSCATAAACAAVGFTTLAGGDVLPRAAIWDGTTWHIANPPRAAHSFATIPSAISCTGTFCLTIGNKAKPTAYVATYNATTATWNDVSTAARLPWPADTCGGACFLPGTLSCATITRCMTAGLAGFYAWNGRAFRRAHPVSAGPGSRLTRVSCASAFCVAVGYRTVKHVRRPLSELWNGSTWKILRQA